MNESYFQWIKTIFTLNATQLLLGFFFLFFFLKMGLCKWTTSKWQKILGYILKGSSVHWEYLIHITYIVYLPRNLMPTNIDKTSLDNK